MKARFPRALLLATAVSAAACGGGGGSGGDSDAPEAAASYAQQCAPTNPFRGDALQPATAGSLASEKRWVNAHMNDVYLWYDEIPDVRPDRSPYSNADDVFGSLENYFLDLLTPAITPSGKHKDEFSFIYPTRAFEELSQSGSSLGYGMELSFSSVTPRDVRVAFVEAESPAGGAGVARGMHLTHVDGASTESNSAADIATLNAGLFRVSEGEVHDFRFENPDGSVLGVRLEVVRVVRHPVPTAQVLVHEGRRVGYLLFNDHIATAESALVDAVAGLRDAGIDDLVLDLRYNGGGFLYIASQLAYMIAGPAVTSGAVFEGLRFNDKRSAESQDSDFPFLDCTRDRDFDCGGSPNLPALNLQRVFVIASGDTCSASEAIVNGLRGIDVEVHQVGGTTCGKPYGFIPADNCGISYFPIEFQSVNAKGFGDYADGFPPDCPATDDLSLALGDPAEASLAAALSMAAGNGCPAGAKALQWSGRLQRPPVRENRLLLPVR